MDRRDLYRSDEETVRIGLGLLQSVLWTSLPGIVQSYNSAQMTVDVQPSINGVIQVDGRYQSVQMPVLLDCPVVWQGGGGVTATFPIEKNDECLVIFASRCIDNWWANGGLQDPGTFRMHDLSDGFALVGLRSKPRSFPIDTSSACLITDDGNTFIKLNPTAKTMTVAASGGINLNGATINESGEITDGLGKILGTHTHAGVTTGTGFSGPPR